MLLLSVFSGVIIDSQLSNSVSVGKDATD